MAVPQRYFIMMIHDDPRSNWNMMSPPDWWFIKRRVVSSCYLWSQRQAWSSGFKSIQIIVSSSNFNMDLFLSPLATEQKSCIIFHLWIHPQNCCHLLSISDSNVDCGEELRDFRKRVAEWGAALGPRLVVNCHLLHVRRVARRACGPLELPKNIEKPAVGPEVGGFSLRVSLSCRTYQINFLVWDDDRRKTVFRRCWWRLWPCSRPHAQHVHDEFHPMSIRLLRRDCYDAPIWAWSSLRASYPKYHHIPSFCCESMVDDGGMTIPCQHLLTPWSMELRKLLSGWTRSPEWTRDPTARCQHPGQGGSGHGCSCGEQARKRVVKYG